VNVREQRSNVMATGPVFGSSVQVDERFHQPTGLKNQSQIDFGQYDQKASFQASSSNYGSTALGGTHEVEDPRFPRKKAYQNQGQPAGRQHFGQPPEEFGVTTGVKRSNKAHQGTFDFMQGQESKSGFGGSGVMRDAYLKERENQDTDQRMGSSYGGSRTQFRELPQEDNAW
jgi:hypothetical protein